MQIEYRPSGKENKNQRRSIRNSTPVQQILRLLGRQPDPPANEPDIKMTMDRAAFVKDESSGIPLNEHLEPQEGVGSREVNFSPELYGQYENFLYNYTMKLSKLRQTPAPPGAPPGINTMFDVIIAHPNGGGEIDKQFYEQIIGNDGKPDADKIAKFLETAEGWMLTSGMMEQQRALTLFAMGLDTAARDAHGALQMERQNVMGNQVIRLGTGQGTVNRWWNNLSHGQRVGAVAGAGALIGLGVGAGVGAAAAVAVGGSALAGGAAGLGINAAAEAGIGAIAGVLSGIEQGNYIDVHQSVDALDYIQNQNPALAARLKYMSGLDVMDYQVIGGAIQIAPGRQPESVRLQENLNTAMSLGMSTQQFYESLGIDPNTMDSSREQFITHGMISHEQSATYLEERAMQLLDINNPNIGGPGIGWAALSVPERLEKYHEAKRKAMLEMFNTVTEKLIAEQTDARLETSVQEIDRKISELASGGEAERRLREQLTNERTTLTQTNEGVDGRNGVRVDIQTMESYNNALQAVNQARDRLSQILGTTDIAAIDREINLRNAVPLERIQQMRGELATMEAQLQAQMAAGEAIDNRFDGGNGAFARVVNIDARLRAVGLPEVGLTPDILRSESIDEIIRRINRAHAAWGARVPPLSEAWPAGENMSPIHRTRLYLVMAESQAQVNPAVRVPSADLNTLRANNISENFLRTATADQIAERLRTVPATAAIGADMNRVNQLVNEAQVRFAARSTALKDVARREEAERNEYNASLGAQRTQLDNEINRDRGEMTTLEAEERTLNGLRNLDTQGSNLFGRLENEYTSAFDRITNWHTQLSGQTPPITDLDPALIAGYTPAQLRGILTTNGRPLPPNPVEADRFLISVISEAQARQTGGPEFTTQHTGTAFADTIGISEKNLRDWNDETLDRYIRTNRLTVTTANLQDMRNARAELQARRDARTNTLLTNIRANAAETAFLRVIPEYVAAETALTNHLARLGVADRAALQVRIDNNTNARANVRELSNQVATMFSNMTAETAGYETAVRNIQTLRTQVGTQLNGANTVEALDRLINLPVEELRTLRTTIVNNEAVVNSGQAVEQYYSNAREIYGRLVFDVDVQPLYAPGREINDAALRTLPFQELLARMNEVHAAGAAAVPPVEVGWPPEDNDRPENRIRLARAMEESRWRALNGAGNPDFNATILGSGTPEHLLLSMTPTEAIAEINRRFGFNALDAANPVDIARAEAFRTQAQNRLNNRIQALNGVIDTNNNRIREIDRRLAQPPGEAAAAQRQQLIEMRRAIVERGDRMSAMSLFSARPTELTLMAPVGAQPDLSPAENAARDAAGNALPRAMIELYDIMFKYRQGPDRETKFRALIDNLPPQQFIDTFVTEIPVLALGGPPPDATAFINRLRIAIDRRRVTSHELRRVVSAISTNFEGRALVMAA